VSCGNVARSVKAVRKAVAKAPEGLIDIEADAKG